MELLAPHYGPIRWDICICNNTYSPYTPSDLIKSQATGLLRAQLPRRLWYSNRLTFEVIHLQHLQCSMFPPIIKYTSQYPPGRGWVVMEPIVPAGLFGFVSGRVLTHQLFTFAIPSRRNTNPISHTLPPLDIFHYSSDIVEG